MTKTIVEKNMGGRLPVRNIANGAEFRIECAMELVPNLMPSIPTTRLP